MNVVKRSVVNHPFISLTIVIVLAVVIYAMIVFPQTQAEKYLAKIKPEDLQKPEVQKIAFDIENASRLTIAQILGGFALLAGLYFTYQNVNVAQRNLRVTEEGKITDRFSKAVEMLGSDKLDVRLGGIYALERIARDSQKDHWTVMEVLTAFVRQNAPYNPFDEESLDQEAERKPREDIQAIMTVIGRRKWSETEKQELILQQVNLAGCILIEANLDKANLRNSNFNCANLDRATLRKAYLSSANLELASLSSANLESAFLNHAVLIRANLHNANLSFTQFTNTHLTHSNLRMADLTETDFRTAQFLTLEQILSAEHFNKANLPPDLEGELKEWQANQTSEKQD